MNYQAIRDQAHIIGENESARLLLRRQLERRAVPAHAERLAGSPAQAPLTPDELIADVKKGIYIVGDGSFSIDQQRYNFQFGGQLFYEIKDGKIGGHAARRRLPVEHPGVLELLRRRSATSATTGWAAPSSTARASRPDQRGVATAASPTRFNGVNVLNTARKI